MNPISRVGGKRVAKIPISPANFGDNQFSKQMKLLQADALLRDTGQSKNGTALRQKNDDPAVMAGKAAAGKKPVELEKGLPVVDSNDYLVILNIAFKNNLLHQNMVGYGDAQRVFLPLSEMSDALDFNIVVNAREGTAKGWFISEDKKFVLDLAKQEVVSDGKTSRLPAGGVEAAGGELYVDSTLLSQWFPVNYDYDFSNQSIQIVPREKLPFQKRLEREQGWNNMRGAVDDTTVFPRKESEYKFISVPFVDMGVGASYTQGTKKDNGFKSDFYLNAKGDLGKMNSDIYLSGNDEDGLENTRFTFRRTDPDGNILGPLKATGIEAGDIRVSRLPIIGGGEIERGVSITNEGILRSREFDTTFFEGNLPPGWDVEVYRNKTLEETQRVGAEGRYNFEDIPVYYGKNDFKLKFYGPQGQEREETKTINVGNDLIKKGKGEYHLTISQKNATIYDPDKADPLDDEKTFKMNARYDYGLDNRLAVGTGISSQEVNGERREYLNLGAKGSFDKFYLSGDYLHDTQGGDAVEFFAQAGLAGADWRFKQRFYDNFIDDNSGSASNLKSETEISASSKIEGNNIIPDLPFTLGYDEIKREDSTFKRVRTRLSAQIKNLNLSNCMNWYEDGSASSVLDGNFQATTQLGKVRLRGRVGYEIEPDPKIKTAELSNFLNINKNISTELFIKKEMDQEDDLENTLRLDWNNGKFNISPQISYNTDGEWSAFLGFSTSFGREPRQGKIKASSTRMADSGAVSAKVYHDKNNNLVFDKGDEVIQNASVKAVQSHQKAETNEGGVAFLTGLPKHKPTDIVLDKDTLEDPFWEPAKESVSIVPRPGHVKEINIPVVTTGEIDGTILTGTKDGVKKPLSGVKIQLMDTEGNLVKEVRSEFDGFYYFQKVMPGQYSVRVRPEDAQKLGIAAKAFDVGIDNQGTVASGQDMVFEPKAETVLAQKADSNLEKDALTRILNQSKEDWALPETIIETPEVPAIQQETALTSSGPDKSSPKLPGKTKFGLHLASYRTPEKAAAGIKYLIHKYQNILGDSDFTIKKVKVSDEKGIWYRVIAGANTNKDRVEQMKTRIKMARPYTKIVTLDNKDELTGKGVHLTSFKTEKKARQSIDELKKEYPSLLKQAEFTIQDVDLGPKLGKWKRVIAGNYDDASEAKALAKRIKMSAPYCKVTPIETENEYGIHMASYRSPEKAALGLRQLQKKFASMLKDEDFSIRKVHLGDKKGVWYRIFAGNFKDANSASYLEHSLKKTGQYACIRRH